MSIVQDYLDLTKKYQTEYGPQTIVLMEVGSFFEVYALIKPDGTYMGSPIVDFAKINEMVIARKTNVFVDKMPVAMAGMGTAYAEKYIQKLQDHHYTIVLYKQDSGNKTSRSLSEIISPGTYFPLETEITSGKLSNNVMCIWLYKSKATKLTPSQVTLGLANIDIYTGKTTLCQFQTNYNHSPATYDELERYISAYKPNECLFVANISMRLIEEIIEFVGLQQTKIHKIDIAPKEEEEAPLSKIETYAKNAEKQIYQMEIMKKFFTHLSTFPEMFPTHSIAIQAFCFLLDFVDQHSPNLAKKLTEPVFENYTDRMLLANHSLSQLNIIDDARHTGKCRSVSSLLNNCVTTMGQRQFMYNLHNPSTHRPTLQASYDITEHFLQKGEVYFLNIRTKLNAITDLEKFTRKIVTRKIMPKNFTALAEDLTTISSLYTDLEGDAVLRDYLQRDKDIQSKAHIASACREIIADLQRVFDLDICRNLSDLNESAIVINRGVSSTFDALLKISMEGGDKLNAIANYLSTLIQQTEKKSAQYVKIHETAKNHAVLLATNRRVTLLKASIKNSGKTTVLLTYKSNYSQTMESFELALNTLEYNSNGSSKTEMVITSKQIRALTSENDEANGKLLKEMQLIFQNYITEFAKFEEALTSIIKYTTEMDLLQCKAYTAHKYNYCKPALQANAGDKSFFNFTGIRHPLIEHLQMNELYVTNDMALGTPNACESGTQSASGILLYGTNAVGKTSFIKSVGIAIIMAQAGLYVPCNTFAYSPYRNVFTRILGNDNLFKGLSTFAVEMTELRTILTLADASSLVLGDELCSGTESDSALSIFTAGLEMLHQKESTFLFATHFHEITKYAEITELTRLKMLHMAVHYDKETNVLVYDRKLREGPGESMYGLEVCKSLNLPDAFLQRAYDIRLKYHPEKQNVLSLSPTHFNSKKLVGNCELCHKHKATEVHHLQHQKNAQANEYITNTTSGLTFHKNHVANLLNICEACHKKIHKSNAQHKVVKTSEGFMLSKL
jgi:DNA mismatch repair protein MutS